MQRSEAELRSELPGNSEGGISKDAIENTGKQPGPNFMRKGKQIARSQV